mmetsp:Transcript_30308/g.89912  ORF Transcript_30308/g.89912 Transcript_30308/m.89912 type:complete len:96 (+) Transcript_30308:1294-1581(+)
MWCFLACAYTLHRQQPPLGQHELHQQQAACCLHASTPGLGIGLCSQRLKAGAVVWSCISTCKHAWHLHKNTVVACGDGGSCQPVAWLYAFSVEQL